MATAKRNRGFTLLEVMIVVAIVGILAAIALPAYQNQVRKGNRSAAQQFMQDVALREQQIMLDMRGYVPVAATADFANAPSASPPGVGLAAPATTTGKYTFVVTRDNTTTPPSYTITATATGNQDKDPALHSMTLDHLGARKTFNASNTQTGTW
jgi:type IV pilus assembly protein PilE